MSGRLGELLVRENLISVQQLRKAQEEQQKSGARIGAETSSRSSEVIHAGLYYPTGSLKHRLCVAGREALYRFCDRRLLPLSERAGSRTLRNARSASGIRHENDGVIAAPDPPG